MLPVHTPRIPKGGTKIPWLLYLSLPPCIPSSIKKQKAVRTVKISCVVAELSIYLAWQSWVLESASSSLQMIPYPVIQVLNYDCNIHVTSTLLFFPEKNELPDCVFECKNICLNNYNLWNVITLKINDKILIIRNIVYLKCLVHILNYLLIKYHDWY
jgi:hypothetical protein